MLGDLEVLVSFWRMQVEVIALMMRFGPGDFPMRGRCCAWVVELYRRDWFFVVQSGIQW